MKDPYYRAKHPNRVIGDLPYLIRDLPLHESSTILQGELTGRDGKPNCKKMKKIRFCCPDTFMMNVEMEYENRDHRIFLFTCFLSAP